VTVKGCIIVWGILLASTAGATDYYVSTSGSDNNSGTSHQQAWRSIAAVNSTAFKAGDRVLFEGGKTFQGSIYLDQDDTGTPAMPVRVGSYGAGRAIIESGNRRGLFLYNTGGIEVSDLIFRGSGQQEGILVYSDLTSTTLHHLHFEGLRVSGYYNAGISIGYGGSVRDFTAFSGIRIHRCEVHDNVDVGIFCWGIFDPEKPVYQIDDVYVGHCRVYRHPGIRNHYKHSGSGILLANTRKALVEFNEVFGNGADNSHPKEGPVGIWAWESTGVVFHYNESHHNSSRTQDGGGFDFDGGVTHSVMQYNYSHDNAGAGFLVTQLRDSHPMTKNTIRYNISERDGRKETKGAVILHAFDGSPGIRDLVIHNNTLFVDKKLNGSVRGIFISNGTIENVGIYNNLIITTGGAPLIDVVQGANPRLAGNAYHDVDGKTRYQFHNNRDLKSLEDLRRITGQETLRGHPTGYEGDPMIAGTGNAGTLGDPVSLLEMDAYRLLPGSPLIDRGIDLSAEFGIEGVSQDFYGQATHSGNGPDIGAFEYNAPLPVRFLHVYAGQQDEGIELKWVVALEVNHSHYGVERSADGEHFTEIGQIASPDTGKGLKQYVFFDPSPTQGRNYYRIRQVDLDGTSTATDIIQVWFNPQVSQPIVVPNPLQNGQFSLIIPGEFTFRISDLQGRTLRSGKGSGDTGFDLNGWPGGSYLLQVTHDGGTIVQKLIIP
jgi:hypothetical protein